MLGLNDIFDLPAYNGELFEDGALTFEVPDAGTDLDWVDFVAQLLALPADPVVDLPWQVSFCPEHFAPANMPFSGHLSDVHPPPPPPLPPPPPPQPQPVADILVFRPAAEVETTEVLQPSQQMAEPEREDVVEAAAEVAGGWEAAPEVEVGVGADVEVEVAAEVAPVPVAAVTVEAPIAGPSRQVRVVVEAPIAGPSRQVRVAEVEPSRKRKREEDDKENQPCKRTAAGPHGCLFSGCMSHIQGTVRDVRRHMDRHFPPRYECSSCHIKYPRPDRLVKHFNANLKCGEVAATVPGAVNSANMFETKMFATPRHEYFTVMPGLGKLRAPEAGHILESEYAEWRRVARSNGTLPDEGA